MQEFREETDPGLRRYLTFERDKGVCQLCSRDVGALEKWVGLSLKAPRERPYGFERRKMRFLRRRGLIGAQGQLYDCDHIVPRVEGGTDKRDNLRTLCVPCHKRVTRELAGRRSKRARTRADDIEARIQARQRFPSIAERDLP